MASQGTSARPLSPDEQKLFDFLPVSGEVAYNDLREAVMASPNRAVLSNFHNMRRAAQIAVRLDVTLNPPALLVSRPA